MSAATSIEWTEATWNPVRGCAVVSPGCTNCYAMRQAHRHAGPGGSYAGLTAASKGGPVWAGRVKLVPESYDAPLHWRKPKRIFVNSMSDLFHEGIDFEHIAGLFGVMAMAPQHTFQVLTKRPARALEFFDWIANDADGPTMGCVLHARDLCGFKTWKYEPSDQGPTWPLANVWLGVSVEDQRRADERIPLLLQTPSAVRWLSLEPLLEHVSLLPWIPRADQRRLGPGGLHWVVVGGESGPGARPFDIAWARSLRDQCKAAGVPFFLKQLGSQARGWCAWHTPECIGEDAAKLRAEGHEARCDNYEASEQAQSCSFYGRACMAISDRKGGAPKEWPEDLRVREYP